MNPRLRQTVLATGVIAAIGFVAWAGYQLTQYYEVTAAKVSQYAGSTNLRALDPASRAEALRRLEGMINGLPPDERRKWRMGGAWKSWFDEMSEAEKGQFIEATMPSGFKQWLNEFDGLPEDSRKKFIGYLAAQLRETHQLVTDREPGQTNSMYGTNEAPQLSAQLESRAQTIGLKTYFTESSAETKAELAPFLEEIQREMQKTNAAPSLAR